MSGPGQGTTGLPGTRFECGVCWWRYDPALGDPAAQIPPRTTFEALPEWWTCPTCDAPRHRFLIAADG